VQCQEVLHEQVECFEIAVGAGLVEGREEVAGVGRLAGQDEELGHLSAGEHRLVGGLVGLGLEPGDHDLGQVSAGDRLPEQARQRRQVVLLQPGRGAGDDGERADCRGAGAERGRVRAAGAAAASPTTSSTESVFRSAYCWAPGMFIIIICCWSMSGPPGPPRPLGVRPSP